jgi:hypothetical protein
MYAEFHAEYGQWFVLDVCSRLEIWAMELLLKFWEEAVSWLFINKFYLHRKCQMSMESVQILSTVAALIQAHMPQK